MAHNKTNYDAKVLQLILFQPTNSKSENILKIDIIRDTIQLKPLEFIF